MLKLPTWRGRLKKWGKSADIFYVRPLKGNIFRKYYFYAFVMNPLHSNFSSTCLKNHGLCQMPISFSMPGLAESVKFPVMTTALLLE